MTDKKKWDNLWNIMVALMVVTLIIIVLLDESYNQIKTIIASIESLAFIYVTFRSIKAKIAEEKQNYTELDHSR